MNETTPQTAQPTTPSMQTFSKGRLVAMVSTLIVIGAAFLPWVTVMEMITASGMDGHGKITAVTALIALILTLIKKVPILVILLLGAVILSIIGYDLYEILSNQTGTESFEVMLEGADNPFAGIDMVSIGVGAYLTILGGIGMVVGAMMEMKKKI